VALYRAEGNTEALSRTTTIVSVWQLFIALFTTIAAVVLSSAIVYWVDFTDTHTADTAKTVMLMLGLTLAVKMLANPAGGLITGCHRWDIQHSINAGQDIVIAFVLISMLVFDAQLIHLAYAVFGIGILTACTRIAFARWLCPEVKIQLKLWQTSQALELLRFGVKTLVNMASNVLVYQTVAILLAGLAGPAALAVFTRGVALVRHAQQLVTKAADMFMPITSSLIGLDRREEVIRLLVDIGRYGLCLSLPMMLGLFAFGDVFLSLWMGEGYADPKMMMVLAVGAIVPSSQLGTMNVLTGLNAHGKVAIYILITTAITLAASVAIAQVLSWSPLTAAMVVGACLTIGRGLVIPLFLKSRFKISLLSYFWRTLITPLFFNVPLMAALWAARWAWEMENWPVFIGTALVGGLATAFIYWNWVLPVPVRESIKKRITRGAAV